MKNRIKTILNSLGIYPIARAVISKFYYPYKNYKIRKEVADILKILKEVLDKNSIDYWLDYGTLLGFVREGKIIGHDLDLDFGIKPKSGVVLAKILKKYDCNLIQQIYVEGKLTVDTYKFRGVDFDIFYYEKRGDKIVNRVWLSNDSSIPQQKAYELGRGKLEDVIFSDIETKEIEFYGVKFRAPKDSDRYLKENYGSNYMVPNPNWKHGDETNRVALSNIDFEVKFYN